ncbi:MAG: TIGR04083 family peptide-modifying radical SAM enzyme [Candidatus Hydrogenedentes bacterium]|nr:TIGR04083 family peptide-modifying radical SAM enzyme [Candidatus Hydrogenedentota bacterium]
MATRVDTVHGTAVPVSSVPDGPRPQFMLVPSLACQARCTYCFGPHQGPVMSPATLDSAIDFVAAIAQETRQPDVKVTFHGGEPLLAGHLVWRRALEGLRDRLGRRLSHISVQSNLWNLDEEFCRLFTEFKVEIGTSLDGPAEITDLQRGRGYFDRTMAGVRRAQEHGLTVGAIATFTPAALDRWREVFDFFLGERIGFSIHASVRPLDRPDGRYALSSEEYGRLLVDLFEYYVGHRRELSVASLDYICRGVATGEGKVCTFRDCLGMFLAIDPAGGVYPCQRFCGRPGYRLGALDEHPTLETLMSSSVATRFRGWETQLRTACGGCAHLDHCRGGCPYNAWASEQAKDPYCQGYHEVFEWVEQRLADEMASEENIRAMAARPYDGTGYPLLREGPLIELARDGPHPSQIARTAKRIVAAVELARGPEFNMVANRLVRLGLCRTDESARVSLDGLRRRLHPATRKLNNLYLHVTLTCQLECAHCYARASAPGSEADSMSVEAIARLVRQAKEAGFRQVVITGGEPLIHPQRDEMLETFRALRPSMAPMNLIVRTNLAMPVSDDNLRRVACTFDQVVASVDGNRETHEARRGLGAYDKVVRNLERYQALCGGGGRWEAGRPAELSIAAVMRAADIQGEVGDAVRELAGRLGVRRTRFRPLLPLGRARDWPEPPTSEALGAHLDPMELIREGFRPVSSCGLGQNLYVEPSGESFPCYAYHARHSLLGNVIENGLQSVLGSAVFQDLSRHNVDTNPKCRVCDVRYLCGGACRAWGGDQAQCDLDAAPAECEGLKRRAMGLLAAAQGYLSDP